MLHIYHFNIKQIDNINADDIRNDSKLYEWVEEDIYCTEPLVLDEDECGVVYTKDIEVIDSRFDEVELSYSSFNLIRDHLSLEYFNKKISDLTTEYRDHFLYNFLIQQDCDCYIGPKYLKKLSQGFVDDPKILDILGKIPDSFLQKKALILYYIIQACHKYEKPYIRLN